MNFHQQYKHTLFVRLLSDPKSLFPVASYITQFMNLRKGSEYIVID